MKASVFYLALIFLLASCDKGKPSTSLQTGKDLPDQFITVLGIAQDAGYPQTGCEKECCKAYRDGKEEKKYVTCLALVDRTTQQYWLFEATPDLQEQLVDLQRTWDIDSMPAPAGILITHAHIGHYTGLMQLGREVMGTKDVPVHVMPRMDSFLRHNGPWSQLVKLENIKLMPLQADSAAWMNNSLKVTSIRVPHRDEFSETVGFVIESSKKKVLFIPDIDKWEKWDRDIKELVKNVDVAFLDGTFYKNGELPGRDMKEIPHPFVEESLQRFSSLTSAERSKIVFIHFNHTNPLLKKQSAEKEMVKKDGFGMAEEGMIIEL